MFGFWHAFFPSYVEEGPRSCQPATAAAASDLLAVALSDLNVRCRAAALHAALSCWCGSRPFLAQADNRLAPGGAQRTAAYTPFAVALGDQVVLMYAAMGVVVRTEPSTPVLMQALKALIVLVQQTAFARLRAGFLGKLVVPAVRNLLRHSSEDLRYVPGQGPKVACECGLIRHPNPQTRMFSAPP